MLLGALIVAVLGLAGFLGPRLFEKTSAEVVTHFLDSVKADDFVAAYGDLNPRFLATYQASSVIRSCGGIDVSTRSIAATTTAETLTAEAVSSTSISAYKVSTPTTFVVDGETFERFEVRFAGLADPTLFLGLTMVHTWSGWSVIGYNNQLGVEAFNRILCPGRS